MAANTTASLASYHYTYGAGSSPNRTISFFRSDDNNPSSVEARVFVYETNTQTCRSIAGSNITVERNSTTDKMNAMVAQRQGMPSTLKPDTTLDQCPIEEQNSMFEGLRNHVWRIGTSNEPGRDYETVVALNLFNPS